MPSNSSSRSNQGYSNAYGHPYENNNTDYYQSSAGSASYGYQTQQQPPQIYTSFHGEAHSSHASSGHYRTNTSFPINDGHTFGVLATRGQRLEPIAAASTPQGIIRASRVNRDEEDPRLKHKCAECGRGFDRPSALDVHMNSHSGKTPFPCPMQDCSKTFSVKSNMTRHVKNVHGFPSDEDHHAKRDRSSPASIRSGTSRGSFDYERSTSPYDSYHASSSSTTRRY
ncbi:hypothetical protein M422DRAFT_244404 [Sphaerobolus stellatus SS14]|nr:hypothetical protein M422DRAFT_244404 [Sphaerobolus stellatus SS14]